MEGEELEAHLAAEREAADLIVKQQAALERSRRMLHVDGDASDSDSDASDAEEDVAEEMAVDGEGGELKVAPIRRRTGGFTGGVGAWDEFLDEDALVGQARGVSFDIYVRGEYGVRKLTDGNGLPRYRMFPVVERKRRVDAYGESIDVEGWLKRGVDEDPLTQRAKQVLGKRTREEEEADAKAAIEEVGPRTPSFPCQISRTDMGILRRRSQKHRTSTLSTRFSSISSRCFSSSTWKDSVTDARSRRSCLRLTPGSLYALSSRRLS